jgi:hypothetical protein
MIHKKPTPIPPVDQLPTPIPGRIAHIPIEAWPAFATLHGLVVSNVRAGTLICVKATLTHEAESK